MKVTPILNFARKLRIFKLFLGIQGYYKDNMVNVANMKVRYTTDFFAATNVFIAPSQKKKESSEEIRPR